MRSFKNSQKKNILHHLSHFLFNIFLPLPKKSIEKHSKLSEINQNLNHLNEDFSSFFPLLPKSYRVNSTTHHKIRSYDDKDYNFFHKPVQKLVKSKKISYFNDKKMILLPVLSKKFQESNALSIEKNVEKSIEKTNKKTGSLVAYIPRPCYIEEKEDNLRL